MQQQKIPKKKFHTSMICFQCYYSSNAYPCYLRFLHILHGRLIGGIKGLDITGQVGEGV